MDVDQYKAFLPQALGTTVLARFESVVFQLIPSNCGIVFESCRCSCIVEVVFGSFVGIVPGFETRFWDYEGTTVSVPRTRMRNIYTEACLPLVHTERVYKA